MVVALAALNLNAEKDPRHLGGGFFGAAVLGHVNRRGAVFPDVARGGDELGGDLVPRFVLVELFGQVDDERIGDDRGTVLQPAKRITSRQ